MAGVELHVKEVREKTVALVAADFTALYPTEKYVVTDRQKVLLPSNETVYVEFDGAGCLKKAIGGESEWRYTLNIYAGVLRTDPDRSQDEMDTLLARTIKSLGAHPKLDGYNMTNPVEEVYRCGLGLTGERDTVAPYRGTIHGTNKFFQIVRLKFYVDTAQRGV